MSNEPITPPLSIEKENRPEANGLSIVLRWISQGRVAARGG